MKSHFVGAAVLLAGAGTALAGPELVSYPEGFQTTFVRYATVDRPDRDPPIVRFLYVNPEALAAAEVGQPLPLGTVIVMEDHLAALDDTDAPITTSDGRFIATAEVTNIFVQEKGESWGGEYPPEVRNGEWEYARFLLDGSPRPDSSYEGCFECHAGQADADYNFTLTPFVELIK